MNMEDLENHILIIPIKSHFSGHYRLEYDGKYITLFGWDNNYPTFDYHTGTYSTSEFEEMVLIPCAMEIRNANPFIKEVMDKVIIIQLNQQEETK